MRILGEKRRFLAALSMGVMVIIIFAMAFIIIQGEHDCTGEGCQICLQITIAQNILKTLIALVFFAPLAGSLKKDRRLVSILRTFVSPLRTPMALKVQFNT
jgi:hypothetical protein